jgi:uncharacterized protein
MVKQSFLMLTTLFWLSACDPPHKHSPDKRMSTLEIIKSTYEGKTSKENGKNLALHLADDASWTEAQGFPYAGTYIGFAAINKNVFSRLASEWIDYKVTPEDYITSGQQVVMYGTYSGKYKSTGKFFKARVAHLWKVENRKIIRFEQIVDSKPVADAMVK